MTTNPSAPSGNTPRAQPESFRARNLSASLTVQDLDKSLAWYCDAIGFVVDQRYEREGQLVAVALKAGDVKILIGRDDGAKGFDREKGEGFSLQFTTTQNIDAIADRIRNHGTPLVTEPADMPWGARVFRVGDPDGFRLVISSERPGDAS